MSRHIPEHPAKGSPEAYAWAEKMKKARLKAKIRKAGLKQEHKFFGPGAPLEVKKSKVDIFYVMLDGSGASNRVHIVNFKDVPHYSQEGFTIYSGPFYSKQEAEAYIKRDLRGVKSNPGAHWHEESARVAGRYRKDAPTNTERLMYAGMEIAHKDSAQAAKKLGMNPKKRQRVKKNPIAIYNPPTAKVAGTIYNNAIEIKAQKTGGPLKGHYKHVFGPNVKIMGLDNGDVLLHHAKGKRLWISEKDYERSGGEES